MSKDDNLLQVKDCVKDCGELGHCKDRIKKLEQLLDESDRAGDKLRGELDDLKFATKE